MTSGEPVMLPALDSPPRVWVDSHDILANLTPDEMEEGNRLGRTIDAEDDEDAGSWHFGLHKPKMLGRLGMSNSLTVAQGIKTALLDHGAGKVVSPYTGKVGGVSIELQAGRGTGGMFVATLNHHTASANITPTVLTPALKTVKNGRSDLQGPLANGYGGGDFVYRLITLEWANHPGLGGPMTFSKGTVPKDNGRPYLWGTEWDWNGISTWPDEYLEWMARCNAGLIDYFGLLVTDQGEHKDWAPLRKIDRNIITRATSIALTRAVYNTAPVPEEDFLSELSDVEQRNLYNWVAAIGQRIPADFSTVVDTAMKRSLYTQVLVEQLARTFEVTLNYTGAQGVQGRTDPAGSAYKLDATEADAVVHLAEEDATALVNSIVEKLTPPAVPTT